MNKRKWVVELIQSLGVEQITSEMVVDRLMEEGILHLGNGNADVDIIVAAFADTFGTTSTSKNDRFAALRLANKHGVQSVVGVIRLLGHLGQDNQYAPVPNNVYELEKKWVSVLKFIRNQKEEIIDA
jgi:hypothetical protein